MEDKAVDYIIKRLISGEKDLNKLKREASAKFSLPHIVKNTRILERFPKEKLTDKLLNIILKKPVRTISGVTPIAVMIKPEDSCKWKCIYCPFTGKAAKSYTGYEPAARRARDNDFDPYRQTKARLGQFRIGGHNTDKCEVIIMGGTFLQMPKEYKEKFVKAIYNALNNKKSKTLQDAKKKNEKAKHRMIGLTIETRPNVCAEYVDELLEYGVTRIELGVQHPNDSIYKRINRGHAVKDVVDTTQKLKDCGFKIAYHIMPGLPGSNRKKDIEMIKRLFADGRFKPDMLKIYPTLVIEGTELYKMMKNGKYKPYTSEQAAEIISEFYRYIPEYVRVMRIQRDIPANLISGGVTKSNLRELVDQKMKENKIIPNEIRSREVGFKTAIEKAEKFDLKRTDYNASGGKEVFLSYETKGGALAGFIRLRIPNSKSKFRKEIDGETALIRELHVYGQEVGIDECDKKKVKVQHTGIGTKLLEEAERIARKEFGKKKMIIISGVGVREYYKKKGYVLIGPYMGKKI